MMTLRPPKEVPGKTEFERYALAAKDAGLTRAQFEIFARAGIVLQEKQLRFAAACFSCDAEDGPTEIGFGGARGGGKSHAGLAVLSADCLRYAGLTCLLLRKVGKANRENFNELRLKVLSSVSTTYKVQESTLLFPNGSKIILGHFQHESDIDTYLGLEYDVILVEEATTLTAAKYQAIKTCNRTSKPGWRPRMYSTTNPGGVGHAWYKKTFIKNNTRETAFVASTVDDNRMVNRGYRKVLDNLVGWQKKAWRFGDWDIAAGQYFTNFRADIHVRELGRGDQYYASGTLGCSLDYGFRHYTTVYLLAKDGDGNVLILDEHAERNWLPGRHATAIHAMLARHGLSVEDLAFFVSGADTFAPRANETGKSIADDYADEGIYLTRANTDRISGASEFLKRFGDLDAEDENKQPKPIEPSLFIDPRCARLIECLPTLEHNPHRPEDVLKVDTDEEGEGGDDFYDGARYGLMEFAEKAAPSNEAMILTPVMTFSNRRR